MTLIHHAISLIQSKKPCIKVDMQSMQSQQYKIELHYGLQSDKSNSADNILSSIAIVIWVWRPNKVSVIISDVHAWGGIVNLVKGLVKPFNFRTVYKSCQTV